MKVLLFLMAFVANSLCSEYIPKKQEAAPAPTNAPPIINALATALPQSLVSAIVANPASAVEMISSQFAAGHTPAWYSNLPASIKSQLAPPTPSVAPGLSSLLTMLTKGPAQVITTTAVVTPSLGPGPAIPSTPLTSNPAYSNLPLAYTPPSNMTMTRYGNHTTTRRYQLSYTYTPTYATQGPQSSTGGAVAKPTAIIGAGLAGLMGLLGIAAV